MAVQVQDAKVTMRNGVGRVGAVDNYTSNFGLQWNAFAETQLDGVGRNENFTAERFFLSTGWSPESLRGQDILEVGSGAGRFSRVILEKTEATLYSVDYSNAVEANLASNGGIAPDRFRLFQASIYEMPFADNSFDKVFCLGVLQHTPNFEDSIRALVQKAKPGGEIAVDFYPIRGPWTKLHAKYLLRPITKRMDNDRLLRIVRDNAGWLLKVYDGMNKVGLRALTRFLPICDIDTTSPAGLTKAQRHEWVVLDTFDQYAPAFDHPQRIKDVAAMFERAGARVTFADFVAIDTSRSAIVRAVKT